MAHDAGVGEQPLDVLRTEARHALGIELREAAPEGLALVEDGEPTQAGLEAFEAQLLEQTTLIGDREAPFAVVVVAVDLRRFAPAAAPGAIRAFEQAGSLARHAALTRTSASIASG